MGYINVFIETVCNMNTDSNNLVLKNDDRCVTYPLEDINCVLIDCLYSKISVYTLNKLCENGATVIVCDDTHLPSSVLLPFNRYYKKLSVLRNQIDLGKPKIRRCGKR